MYLAIDLGGTKTLICLLDNEGVVKNSIKFPTPQDYNQFLDELSSVVSSMLNGVQIDSACMAIPGTVDRESGFILRLGNLSWHENINIREDVQSRLGIRLILENDANLAGLSEANLIKDTYKKALYVTVSTGIGSVFVVDGKIDQNTINSEVGHTLFWHDNKLTEWEDIASGKWITATYGMRASELEDNNAWRNISKNISVGLVNLNLVLTPDVIIIGGGVGAHLDKFKAILEEEIQTINPKFVTMPPIVKAQKPEEAVIYGCYQLLTNS